MVKIGVTTFDLEAFEMHSNQCFEKKKILFNFFIYFKIILIYYIKNIFLK